MTDDLSSKDKDAQHRPVPLLLQHRLILQFTLATLKVPEQPDRQGHLDRILWQPSTGETHGGREKRPWSGGVGKRPTS